MVYPGGATLFQHLKRSTPMRKVSLRISGHTAKKYTKSKRRERMERDKRYSSLGRVEQGV